ncbi:MAG: penicillin acylase family protein [Actinobacteria bacterium]|nr:MAG: penicillin acylase family protein [Actinomycetota bacterium]
MALIEYCVMRRASRGALGWRRACGGALGLTVAALALAVAASPAGAQSPPALTVPAFGGFRSVLAQGEGQSVTATDLAAYEATGNPPDTFVNQQPLYVDIMPHAGTLTASDLDRYYKNTTFGQMPGGVGSVASPIPGVEIFRDKKFGMAHIYGDNRAHVMFGAGYATAQERLFLMDAVRHTAEGNLAELTGPGAASGDSDQLTDQDFSLQELTAQFNALPSRYGAAGARAHADILAYIAGINQRIDEVNANPLEMPAEYPALGVHQVKRWIPADTAAEAVFLVTQFTVSNGGEERNSQLQEAFMKRFGTGWRRPYHDLREAQDPEAFTVAKRPFLSDRTGRPRKGLNAMPDFGSIVKRNTIVQGPSAAASAKAAARMPAWVRSLDRFKRSLPTVESNAVMVPRRLSSTGHALAAMGPQVGYYSPQIFSEYELHGGGIDGEGVTFPGASPWPLIGHGIDFAWSGTSANGDNEDTFVERLCNPDHSKPSMKSTHYVYRGRCVAFTMRDQQVHTPVSPVDPTPPQTITYRTMRSVHGPVFAYATVGRAPVALAKAKGVDFQELGAAIPFMRLAENAPTDVRSFMRVMSPFPGTENWFYVDRRDVGFIQSGFYPLHARGSNVDRPFRGDGRADWLGFKPRTYSYRRLPLSHRPQAVNPTRGGGLIVSWNNKEAPGWRKGPTEWSNGPVHHAMILQNHVFAQARRTGGKVNLTQLTRAVNLAATTDLRGEDVYPWIRRVIGRVSGTDEQMLQIMDAWVRSGSNRLDRNGDNVYEHSAAILLMDALWPRLVRAEFQPALGKNLFDFVESNVLGIGGPDDWGWVWASHVQKDLRSVLGRHERGRYSQIYCGGPTREPVHGKRLRRTRNRCRNVLIQALRGAVAEVASKQGSDTSKWTLVATCKDENPPLCDQIVPNTAGAVDTPPFPWQNRGTYHQIDEIAGHR